MSLAESATNLVVGYAVAVALQLVMFPLFDMRPRLDENLEIAAVFTLASLARSYGLRRCFEQWRRS